ncbi:hypothetical protein L3Q82_008324 [Scortum barcoo]|uniref:Uncharacterized protein n=1 Tax=Scortum barcoo TaxID=214431 RepID=A0ACB8WHK5_9TELE|nr:hypothetical protein L3Q82_008324 [Scortum barcoo]
MEDDAPVIYGLEFQARALTAQTAETDAIRFLVGTQSLKFDNQIHIIDFDDENNIINKNVLLHQAGEIWHIGASPADKAVLTTCYNKTSDSRVVSCAAVWRMPSDWETGSHESPDDSTHNPQTLELLCHLDDSAHSNAACVLWEPMGDGKRVISLADNHALLWDLQESSTQATVSSTATLEGKGQLKFTSGKWSPHHNCSQLATANDTAIRGWDLRTMRSGTGSRRQQSEQRCPDFPHPRHFLQLFRGPPRRAPGQPRDIVSPACPGSSLEASSRWDMPGTPP